MKKRKTTAFVLVVKTEDCYSENQKTNYLVTTQDKFNTRELEDALKENLKERIECIDDEDDVKEMLGLLVGGMSWTDGEDEYYWEELEII